MNKRIPMLWLAGIALLAGAAQAKSDSWKQAKALEIYAHAVSIRTVKGQGKVPELAAYLAGLVAGESVAVQVTGNPTAAPASPLREDVVAAVRAAMANRFGDVEIVGKMSAGATDGLEFRLAGIPTYGTSGIFMKPNEMRAHGVNERLPTENLTGGIDHWEILIRHLAGPGE